jgi:hypothetical protein
MVLWERGRPARKSRGGRDARAPRQPEPLEIIASNSARSSVVSVTRYVLAMVPSLPGGVRLPSGAIRQGRRTNSTTQGRQTPSNVLQLGNISPQWAQRVRRPRGLEERGESTGARVRSGGRGIGTLRISPLQRILEHTQPVDLVFREFGSGGSRRGCVGNNRLSRRIPETRGTEARAAGGGRPPGVPRLHGSALPPKTPRPAAAAEPSLREEARAPLPVVPILARVEPP